MPDHIIPLHVVIIVGQIVSLVYAWLAEGRRHRWQQEMQHRIRTIQEKE
jgi:hypothetical protein